MTNSSEDNQIVVQPEHIDELAVEQQSTLVLLDTYYGSLRSGENRQPMPDDPIRVRINPDNVEHERLVDSGLPEEKLENGNLTRQELLDAGFCFINTLGNGEKGIISGIVDDPDSDLSVDFTGRKLLTKEELQLAYRYQLAHPETYGLQGQDVEEVRKDMMSFLMQSSAQPLFGSKEHAVVDIMSDQSFMYGVREDGYSLDDWKTVEAYVDKRAKLMMRDNPSITDIQAGILAQNELVEACCGDLYESVDDSVGHFNAKSVRGQNTQSLMMMRQGSLQGQPSPFLESGLVFGGNLDVNVFTGADADIRSTDQLRMNIATVHLAGGHPDFPGFSEMGGVSADQKYMPTGYYVNNIYSSDPDLRKATQASEDAMLVSSSRRDILEAAQARLIEAVKEVPVDAIGFKGLMPQPNVWEKIRSLVGRPSKNRKYMENESENSRQRASRNHSELMDANKLARTDMLTGLLNKRGFQEGLSRLVESVKGQTNPRLAMLFIDLDNFKTVNDEHPEKHAAGDSVLKEFAEKLWAELQLREDEIVGRLGGDEFAVGIRTHVKGNTRRDPNLTDQEVLEGLIARIEEQVKEISQKIGIPELGASIGVVKYRKGESAEQFIARADKEMYEIKEARKK